MHESTAFHGRRHDNPAGPRSPTTSSAHNRNLRPQLGYNQGPNPLRARLARHFATPCAWCPPTMLPERAGSARHPPLHRRLRPAHRRIARSRRSRLAWPGQAGRPTEPTARRPTRSRSRFVRRSRWATTPSLPRGLLFDHLTTSPLAATSSRNAAGERGRSSPNQYGREPTAGTTTAMATTPAASNVRRGTGLIA